MHHELDNGHRMFPRCLTRMASWAARPNLAKTCVMSFSGLLSVLEYIDALLEAKIRCRTVAEQDSVGVVDGESVAVGRSGLIISLL